MIIPMVKDSTNIVNSFLRNPAKYIYFVINFQYFLFYLYIFYIYSNKIYKTYNYCHLVIQYFDQIVLE